jgi:NADH-quinone oxidoreductase subunit N
MNSTELLLLLPFITLSSVILALMMVIAFARNLALTCGVSAIGLILTLVSIVWVNINVPHGSVTPLFIIDAYGLMFSGLIVAGSFFICLIAYGYCAQRGEKQEELFLLLLLSALGGMTLAHSAHFAMFILGLELLGVSLYAMISYRTRGLFGLEAALKYLILSGVSSAIILFGIALLYAVLGTLSFAEMAASHYQETGLDRLYILVGTGMLLAGIGFKLSLAPFHMWTPDVYEGAPAPVTAFLATVSKGAIFAVLLRFFITVDGYQYEAILSGLFWIALVSILLGNLLALMQTSIKRMLAYSSIAQMGYLMVAFIAASAVGGKQLAIEASAFFLIAYFLTTIGAFGVITIMSTEEGDHDVDTLEVYSGLFWQRPVLAGFFSAMLLSLAGIPLTAGFIGKFYIVAAGVESELWTLLLAVVVGSGIGLFYYLRVIYTMTKPSETTEITVPVIGGWAMAAVTLFLLILGVYPTPVIEWVSQMALSML